MELRVSVPRGCRAAAACGGSGLIVGWNQEVLIIGCEYGLADDWGWV
jgi:hypothetical protein